MTRSVMPYNTLCLVDEITSNIYFSFIHANIKTTANKHLPSCEILLHRLQSLSEVLKHD